MNNCYRPRKLEQQVEKYRSVILTLYSLDKVAYEPGVAWNKCEYLFLVTVYRCVTIPMSRFIGTGDKFTVKVKIKLKMTFISNLPLP